MAKIAKSLRYELAREELDAFIEALPAATGRLTKSEIEEKYPYSIDGWRVPIECGEEVYSIDYLIDLNFPYTKPRLALLEYKLGSQWPHLLEGNYLCLLSDDASLDPRSPIMVFEYLIKEAHELILKCKAGELDDDFEEEFLSYWALRVTEPETPILSLLNPVGPTRHINLLEGTQSLVACEKHAEGEAWLANRYGKKYPKLPVKKALLLWLGAPPKLKGFSRTNSALLSWLDDLDREEAKILNKALKSPECMVIFGFDAGYGTALAAVKVKPSVTNSKGKGRKENIKARLAETEQTQLYGVQRVDHSWLHGRDQDARSDVLKNKSVVLIGCGAIGGSIAEMLAETGVGVIDCIDPGVLEWGNIGRHVLGGKDVGEIKSKALVRKLHRRFPHLKIKDHGTYGWQEVYWNDKDVLNKADLVISTTGSWQAEAQLNDLAQASPGFPPVLYGWAEAHACAGHALLIPSGGACLACHFEVNGKPIHKTVSWGPATQLSREPACGTFFQPFGPIELSFINSLIADEALGALLGSPRCASWSTWISPKDRVIEMGGTWDSEWVNLYGDPGEGGFRSRRDWLRKPDCHICAESDNKVARD